MQAKASALAACQRCGRRLNDTDLDCPACGEPRAPLEPTVVKSIAEVLEGKWALEQKLGQGGMGTVYLATDLQLDRKVAVKMMAASLCNDESVVSRFEREAKMMAKLDHPNLVPIYAVGRKNNVPFLVMKCLEGTNLSDHLRERGALPLTELLSITRQVCAGLSFVHARGVIHRDIKPANIFIGPDGHVTLLDLGVAHDAKSSMTKSGLLIGTPKYMSPEQILGKKVDHRADLYALGTVLYEASTGSPVFDGDSDFSVMKAHTDTAPADPTGTAELPPAVAGVIVRALAKSPDERFQSATELYEALESAAREGGTVDFVIPSGPQETVVQRTPRATPAPVETRQAQRTRSGSDVRPLTVLPPIAKRTPAPVQGRTPAPRRQLPAAQPVPAPAVQGPNTSAAMAAIHRPKWPIALGAAVVLLGAAAGGLALLRNRAGPAIDPAIDPASDLATEPVADPAEDPAAPAADPPPEPADPARTANADPEPPEPPVRATAERPVVPVRPPTRPIERVPRPRPVASPKPAPVVAARPTEVTINTTQGGSISWAWLDVDGIRRGSTPKKVALTPGRHTIKLERPGFKSIVREISVTAGESMKLNLEMDPS